MRDLTESKLPKWPFVAGDLCLLGVAYFISTHSAGMGQMILLSASVAAGAALAILPFVLEYRLVARLAESQELTTASAQLQNLENLATQISGATARWQQVHEGADKTAIAARGIAERMEAEVRSFT